MFMRVGDRGVIGGVEDVLDAFLPKIIPEKNLLVVFLLTGYICHSNYKKTLKAPLSDQKRTHRNLIAIPTYTQ